MSTPLTAVLVVKGSTPPAGATVIASGMIAIDSYHDVVRES